MPSCPPAPGARARPACGPRPCQPRCPASRAGILEPLIADDRRSSRRRWTRRPCEVPASSSVVTARSPSREAPAEPPASGSPAPLNFRSNTGPPPPQNRFAGAAITARPRQFGRGGAGKAFVLHAQRRFSWRRAVAGLWPPAVPVDARHGPQHLQGILHTSPKVSSDGAVGLGRSRRGSACCSTTSLYASSTHHIDHPGPRATCTPGFGTFVTCLLPPGAAPTSGGWCSEHVGCLGYTPELPDHEVLRR